jgi:CRISPR-associated exonuclease Cas4
MSDADLIALSAPQHFLFCPRQCALIHIEQAWAENAATAEGQVAHQRVHGLLPHLQASLLARTLRGDLDAYPALVWR